MNKYLIYGFLDGLEKYAAGPGVVVPGLIQITGSKRPPAKGTMATIKTLRNPNLVNVIKARIPKPHLRTPHHPFLSLTKSFKM